MTSFDRRFLIASGLIATVWLSGGAIVVPWLIRAAYAQESLPLLNDVFAGRSAHPVDNYVNEWLSLFRMATVALLGILAATYLLLRNRVRVGGALRSMFRPPAAVTFSPRQAVLVSVATGLLAGFAEAAAVLVRVVVRNQPSWGDGVSAEIVWMAPLGYALLFGVVAMLITVLLDRVWKKHIPVRFLVFLLAMLACYCLFRSLRIGFHPLALAVLAVGIATQLTRWSESAPLRVVRNARRWSIGAATAGALCAVALAVGDRTRRPTGDPPEGAVNVLLIILDTVRAASMGFLGHDGGTTPGLDRLADSALIFENAISVAPWTLPSHASMFTGRLPHELKATWTRPLDDRYPTIAEVLSANGYRTGGFIGNEYYVSRRSGLGRGFQTYEDQPISAKMLVANTWALRKLVARLSGREDVVPPHGMWGRNKADDINRKFLKWLDRGDDRPFFAFLNYMDAHDPYYAAAPYDTMFGGQRIKLRWDWNDRYTPAELRERTTAYHRSIRFLDAQLTELFAQLERRGALDNTIVMITSDHGEQFGERTPKQMAHGRNLYLSVLHVPLVIVYPADRGVSGRITQPVSTMNVAATILDVTGVERNTLPGESLAWYGTAAPGSAPPSTAAAKMAVAPSEMERPRPFEAKRANWKMPMRSLLEGPRHYIRNGDGSEELYDVTTDRWERKELVGPQRDTLLLRFRTALSSAFRAESAFIAGLNGSNR